MITIFVNLINKSIYFTEVLSGEKKKNNYNIPAGET